MALKVMLAGRAARTLCAWGRAERGVSCTWGTAGKGGRCVGVYRVELSELPGESASAHALLDCTQATSWLRYCVRHLSRYSSSSSSFDVHVAPVEMALVGS